MACPELKPGAAEPSISDGAEKIVVIDDLRRGALA